jgi:hypothetical protein
MPRSQREARSSGALYAAGTQCWPQALGAIQSDPDGGRGWRDRAVSRGAWCLGVFLPLPRQVGQLHVLNA